MSILVVVTSASIWWLGFGSFGRKCEIGKDEVKKKMIFGGRESNCRDTIFVNPVLDDQALAQEVPHNEVCRV